MSPARHQPHQCWASPRLLCLSLALPEAFRNSGYGTGNPNWQPLTLSGLPAQPRACLKAYDHHHHHHSAPAPCTTHTNTPPSPASPPRNWGACRASTACYRSPLSEPPFPHPKPAPIPNLLLLTPSTASSLLRVPTLLPPAVRSLGAEDGGDARWQQRWRCRWRW